jgi:hypothetical protein
LSSTSPATIDTDEQKDENNNKQYDDANPHAADLLLVVDAGFSTRPCKASQSCDTAAITKTIATNGTLIVVAEETQLCVVAASLQLI